LRKLKKLEVGKKLDIDFEKKKKEIKIKAAPDILDLAGTLRPKRKIIKAVKLRKKMAKMYRPR